jgi:hypothetical protein
MDAERWMSAQSEILTNMETIVTGWAQRQRKAFEAGSRSIRRIYGSRNILELVQAQQELMSDCLQWTASEIRAVGDDTTMITRKATEQFGETADRRQQGNLSREVVSSVPVERAAAE